MVIPLFDIYFIIILNLVKIFLKHIIFFVILQR